MAHGRMEAEFRYEWLDDYVCVVYMTVGRARWYAIADRNALDAPLNWIGDML